MAGTIGQTTVNQYVAGNDAVALTGNVKVNNYALIKSMVLTTDGTLIYVGLDKTVSPDGAGGTPGGYVLGPSDEITIPASAAGNGNLIFLVSANSSQNVCYLIV
jgi:hypothetical protein